MLFVKTLVRIILVPILLCMIMVQWIGTLIHAVSAPIIKLLAAALCLIAVCSWIFGIGTGKEVLCVLMISMILRILPVAAELLVQRIAAVRSLAMAYLFL